MGRLIPAGTGVSKYRSAQLLIEDPEEPVQVPEEIDENDDGYEQEVAEMTAAVQGVEETPDEGEAGEE